MKQPTKPIKPKEPLARDFPNEPISDRNKFVVAYRQYLDDSAQYAEDFEVYEQHKLIRFIKNADIRLCLKKYKIVKR